MKIATKTKTKFQDF